jgi:hypothetical protein
MQLNLPSFYGINVRGAGDPLQSDYFGAPTFRFVSFLLPLGCSTDGSHVSIIRDGPSEQSMARHVMIPIVLLLLRERT